MPGIFSADAQASSSVCQYTSWWSASQHMHYFFVFMLIDYIGQPRHKLINFTFGFVQASNTWRRVHEIFFAIAAYIDDLKMPSHTRHVLLTPFALHFPQPLPGTTTQNRNVDLRYWVDIGECLPPRTTSPAHPHIFDTLHGYIMGSMRHDYLFPRAMVTSVLSSRRPPFRFSPRQ